MGQARTEGAGQQQEHTPRNTHSLAVSIKYAQQVERQKIQTNKQKNSTHSQPTNNKTTHI